MTTRAVRDAIYAWMGDLDSPVDHTALAGRFWALSKIDEWRADGDMGACLRWDGSLNDKGYPIFTIKGVALYAHRVAARIGFDGVSPPRAVPSGMTVDHVRDRKCTFRDCVWPMHLDVVTQSVNGQRVRNLDVFT